MSGIRSKNTRPEVFLRQGLHAHGFRYRLHAQNIPGKPDIVFPKYGAIVVVHGCYWHGHNCRYFKWPKTNQDFWREKIAANKKRDRRDLRMQKQLGWRVLVVWECAVRRNWREQDFDVVQLVIDWLSGPCESAVLDEKGVHQ